MCIHKCSQRSTLHIFLYMFLPYFFKTVPLAKLTDLAGQQLLGTLNLLLCILGIAGSCARLFMWVGVTCSGDPANILVMCSKRLLPERSPQPLSSTAAAHWWFCLQKVPLCLPDVGFFIIIIFFFSSKFVNWNFIIRRSFPFCPHQYLFSYLLKSL